MDGFETNEGVILIAATNRPDVLDPALLRPGRFDRRVVVGMPDVAGRAEILQVHTDKVPLADSVDLDVLARGTPGFAGADLQNLVNEAALNAAKEDKPEVAMADFERAKDKVLMGAERKSMIMSENELINTAYHESGHALVAAMMEHADPVHKITIVPRGRALGLTQMLPEQDRHSVSKRYAQDQICIMFGGRVAEEIKFNEMTTGAGDDLNKATELARNMVCKWGMSDELGPLTFGNREESLFLGREITRHIEYSPKTAETIDAEVHRIMMEQYHRAREVLERNRELLERLAQELLKYETLDFADLREVLAGRDMTRPPPKARLTTREERDRQRQQVSTTPERSPSTLLGPLVESGTRA
jgi:cell division protease FtsH